MTSSQVGSARSPRNAHPSPRRSEQSNGGEGFVDASWHHLAWWQPGPSRPEPESSSFAAEPAPATGSSATGSSGRTALGGDKGPCLGFSKAQNERAHAGALACHRQVHARSTKAVNARVDSGTGRPSPQRLPKVPDHSFERLASIKLPRCPVSITVLHTHKFQDGNSSSSRCRHLSLSVSVFLGWFYVRTCLQATIAGTHPGMSSVSSLTRAFPGPTTELGHSNACRFVRGGRVVRAEATR